MAAQLARSALPLLLSLRYTAFWYSTDGDYLSEEPLLLRRQLRDAYHWCEGAELPSIGYAADSSQYYAPAPDVSRGSWFGARAWRFGR